MKTTIYNERIENSIGSTINELISVNSIQKALLLLFVSGS